MPLYCLHSGSTDTIFVFPEDTANNGTPSDDDVRSFNLPNLTAPEGLTVLGNDLYVLSQELGNHTVTIVPADTQDGQTATASRQFLLPTTIAAPYGLAIDGNDLYVSGAFRDTIYIVAANTSNNATATISRQFNMPTGLLDARGLFLDGNDLYVVNNNDDDIFVMPADTGNNQTPADNDVREFALPSGVATPEGVAIGGNNLYVVDDSGNEVYVVSKNTADGQTATELRRFNLPSGLTTPQGLTFVSNQATLTISTDDTDIRAGETVDFTISSDIDIDDFTAADISVTNGSKVPPLVKVSDTEYMMTITAGSPGTLTIAIAEDVVTPGNAAVSQDFTVNALVATTLEIVSGNNQSGSVGERLSDSLVVRVLDQNGDAFSGATINFSTTGGTLDTTSATTGSNGQASTRLTLPDTPGDYTVTASVTGLTDVTFTATATAIPLMLAWQVPSGTVDGTFSVTLTSNYTITGVALSDFVLRREDAQFTNLNSSNAVLTNVSGTNNWRIDITLTGTLDHDFVIRLRPNRVQYDGDNYPSSSLNSANFHVDTRVIATTLEIISGNNQSAQVGTALANPLVVEVEDQNGNPFDGATVTFSTTGGTLSETSVTTGADGRASTELTLPSTDGNYTVTASVSGLTDVTFTATATAEALVATTVVIVSGNNQTAGANTDLANPLVVQVNDQNGDALGGVSVAFTVNPTDASLNPTSDTTDANGRASTDLTLGAMNGTYTVTATVSGLTPVMFTATATAVATTLTIVSGNNQSATVSSALTDPVVVRVDDQNGDPLESFAIAFAISPTDGALGTASATTDASGEAQTTVQLGAMNGTYTITASGTGLTSVMFTATATMMVEPETPVVATQQELTAGNLFSIDANGDITDKGFVWHTERPYNVFIGKMLVVGDDLHVMAGYGDPDKILQNESLASKADNFVHLVFGETLRYILPTFTPDSSIHAELSTLAKNVNATVSFTNGIIQIADRLPFRALTNGQTGTGTANIAYNGQNKPFPASGYILVGSEVISYTGNAGGAFTGVGRGVLGTSIVNHFDNSRILYLDNIVESTYLSLNLQSDTNRVYNIIRNSDLTVEVRDAASIALYGERAYVLDLGLTRHENAWISSIFNEYLAELKNLQDIVNLQLRRDPALALGDIVPFEHEGVIKAMRIVSLRDAQARTTIRGRTITV